VFRAAGSAWAVEGWSESGLLRLAATIALTHHERWDGGGYTQGLVDERIPIEGRITAVADVNDASDAARALDPQGSGSTAAWPLV
jgi:response regulator RpfG family c-di-GMP phosphodiesterase